MHTVAHCAGLMLPVKPVLLEAGAMSKYVQGSTTISRALIENSTMVQWKILGTRCCFCLNLWFSSTASFSSLHCFSVCCHSQAMSGRNVAACGQHPYRPYRPMFKQDIAVTFSPSHGSFSTNPRRHCRASVPLITPKQSHAHEVRLKHVDYTGTGARMPATCSAS